MEQGHRGQSRETACTTRQTTTGTPDGGQGGCSSTGEGGSGLFPSKAASASGADHPQLRAPPALGSPKAKTRCPEAGGLPTTTRFQRCPMAVGINPALSTSRSKRQSKPLRKRWP